MQITHSIALTVLGTAVAACAHAVPPELEHARTAYERARAGRTAQLAPTELHKAHTALEVAEKAFDEEPEGQVTRDLAYVALRKVELADVTAVRAAQKEVKEGAQLAYEQAESKKLAQAQGALSQSQAQLQAAQASTQQAAQKNQELNERLSQLANMREDERGTVLTLSGSLLFPSNKATLTPAARERLSELSEALMTQQGRGIRIEGFTDSRGSEELNMALSQKRADAVRSYLVSRGYQPELVEAEGKGESEPIASNDDPDGRANNRRVEIVLDSAK